MPRYFTAEDETEMTFQLVEEIEGCRRFKISVDNQTDRLMLLVKSECDRGIEDAYNTLEILLTWGMIHFKELPLWTNSVEHIKGDKL